MFVTLPLFSELTAKEATRGAAALFTIQAETIKEEGYVPECYFCDPLSSIWLLIVWTIPLLFVQGPPTYYYCWLSSCYRIFMASFVCLFYCCCLQLFNTHSSTSSACLCIALQFYCILLLPILALFSHTLGRCVYPFRRAWISPSLQIWNFY